jgi:type II secretory pathway component PulF
MDDKQPSRPTLSERSPILRWLRGERKPSRVASVPDALDAGNRPALPKGIERFLARKPGWTGPRYLWQSSWRRDLLDVTGALAATARANRPLASGMNALLNELLAKRAGTSMFERQSSLISLIGALAVFGGSIALWVSIVETEILRLFASPDFDSFAYMLMAGYGLATLLACLGAYVLLRRFTSGWKKRTTVLAALHRHLDHGEPLSEAMRKLHRFFPRHYADLAAAGERTGQLAECLTQLESESSTRLLETQGGRLPFRYLAIVVVITFVGALFSYTKLHPVFIEVIEDFGGVSSESFWLSGMLRDYVDTGTWYFLIPFDYPQRLFFYLLPLLFVPAFRIASRQPRVVSWFLLFPWFGHTAKLRSLHHASLLLGRELDAGIPMVESLGHVAAADIPLSHRRVFERVGARVQQGETMGDALREARHGFPPGFVCFVELGEQSGQLPQALKQVAQLYWPVIQARQRITRTVTLCACVLAVSALVLVVVETTFALNVAVMDAIFYAL